MIGRRTWKILKVTSLFMSLGSKSLLTSRCENALLIGSDTTLLLYMGEKPGLLVMVFFHSTIVVPND